MRTPVLTTLALLALALAPRVARAGDPPAKAPDVQTVNGVTATITSSTQVLPASPSRDPRLRRHNLTTALPANHAALDAAQRVKLASAPSAMPAPAAPPIGDKLSDLSGSLPAPAGAPTLAALQARKAVHETRGHGLVDAFGVLPRPEWTKGLPVKPREMTTVGAPTGLDRAGTAVPEPARATRTLDARGNVDQATTRARNAALPAKGAAKAGPGGGGKEDRP